MDSITHLAVGACLGEAFAGKKLGKKAMLWGALAQSVPDIDFLAAFWMDTASNLLAHRGFTHSFAFCAFITFFMALLAERLHRPHNIRLKQWLLFFGGGIFLHVFLDAFNNYGVGWLEPFSHHRFSFHLIYVADPFFSVWIAIACVALFTLRRTSRQRKKWLVGGLLFSGMYLAYSVFNKSIIDADSKHALKAQNISYNRYISTPAPLQNWLWFIVAGNDSGYHVGFHSVFAGKDNISFEYFPRNDSLLNPIRHHEDVQKLIRFSQQFYTVEHWNDTLVFNDLRFGQMVGWHDPRAKFVFHYFLKHDADNILVVQRGRFKGWNRENARSFLDRIRGD